MQACVRRSRPDGSRKNVLRRGEAKASAWSDSDTRSLRSLHAWEIYGRENKGANAIARGVNRKGLTYRQAGQTGFLYPTRATSASCFVQTLAAGTIQCWPSQV